MSDGSYSRREFLKIAGVAGAAVGAAGGLAACWQPARTEETTTTAAPRPRRRQSGPTTTAATAGSTTTVSTGPRPAREIKIGFVAPLTGSLASFGVPDKYGDRATKAFGDAYLGGDGKTHKISIATGTASPTPTGPPRSLGT